MGYIKSNIFKKYGQYLITLLMLVIVSFTSCPIRSGIKRLIELPINTVQGRLTQPVAPIENGSERCSESIENRNTRIVFAQGRLLLPRNVCTDILFYAFSTHRHLKINSIQYSNQSTTRTLLIFLQYQTLRI